MSVENLEVAPLVQCCYIVSIQLCLYDFCIYPRGSWGSAMRRTKTQHFVCFNLAFFDIVMDLFSLRDDSVSYRNCTTIRIGSRDSMEGG